METNEQHHLEKLKELKEQYIKSLKKYNDQLDIYVSKDLGSGVYIGDKHVFAYTYQEISKKYGISKSKVQRIAKKFDLSRNSDTKPNDTECRCWSDYR